MKKKNSILHDGLFTVLTLICTFLLNLFIQKHFDTRTLVPMLFVLGVFLISRRTRGYFWGVFSSMVSVLAVNYTFTYPYWAFDLISPENFFSAVTMLIVSISTGTLTTEIKVQEKIRAEIEKERMRANLLRAVSHDLRTPLTSIYGSTTTIIDNYDLLSEAQEKKLLREVRDDAQWLIRMVENLLSVTQIDSNTAMVKKAPVVLEEVIDSVLVQFRKHCPDQEVEVTMPDDFILIPMDPMLIQQVLLNLLENAVYHAANMTHLKLQIELSGKSVCFTVSDDGCGIPAERLKNLFTGYLDQPTVPADGSRHNMGIGLSVCASIIKAHGSEIHVKNNPEGGASFSFCLELEDSNE